MISIAVQPRVCGGTPPQVQRCVLGLRFSPACAGNASRQQSGLRDPAVQPRVCGERDQAAILEKCASGSAPRVRGTPAKDARDTCERRFSPACAGNAASIASSRRWTTVQPRVCGERVMPRLDLPATRGSAPRVRGTHVVGDETEDIARFSPACAGNATPRSWRPGSTTVQPRVCGERQRAEQHDHQLDGSAPRVRGTRCLALAFSSIRRFSPACAGNASSCHTC